jgi:alpha-beta hydrolase superfamily lysophospholipase
MLFFLLLNLLAYVGAYGLTHFRTPGHLGIGLPRPTNARLPADVGLEYVTQRIAIDRHQWLETWLLPASVNPPRGTVLLFPGNAGSKAKQLLAPAQVLHQLHYNTLLVDFRGVGGSSGNATTLGAREAQDVLLAVQQAQRLNLQRPLILYGVSMGSVAILRAIAHQKVRVDAVILELPFARMLDAVRSRVRAIGLPAFPTAELLVFWGSVQHGFNGFAHNPVVDARQVQCPALLLHGKRDPWTTVAEINQIFQNLRGVKQQVIFPKAGHHLLVTADKKLWEQSITEFLSKV